MADFSELKTLLAEQGDAWAEHKAKTEARLLDLEKLHARREATGGPRASREHTSYSATPDEHKALDRVVRKWISGDAAGLAQAVEDYQSKTMRAGIDPDGGFVVGTQVGPFVEKMAEVSPIISFANTITLRTGSSLEGIEDLGAASAAWVGEEQARPETDTPRISKYRIELKEIYAQPKLTQTLVDVADVDVVQWALDKVATAFAVAEEDAMVRGDGLSRWRGFATYPTAATGDATRAWGTFEHVNTGSATGFGTSKADVLIDLAHKLKPRYRANARWFMPQETLAAVRKLKESTSDQYLWTPGLMDGEPDRLLGYPITVCNALPAVASGSLSVWFGSMADAYTIIRRPGIRLLNDNLTEKPFVKLYSYARSGGQPVNFEAIKALRFA